MPRSCYLTIIEIYLLELLQVKTTLGDQFPLQYLALDKSFTSTLEIHIQRQRHIIFIYLKITAEECTADVDPGWHLVCLHCLGCAHYHVCSLWTYLEEPHRLQSNYREL